MKLTTEEIHNIYLHQSGVAEGLLKAGADADFPVLFANALLGLSLAAAGFRFRFRQ